MGGVQHWRLWRQPLIDEPQEVRLGSAVKRERRLVEQHDRLVLAFELAERRQEGEEPLESRRSLGEVVGVPGSVVGEPNVEESRDRSGAVVPLDGFLVDVDHHLQVGVLLPVLEDLSGQVDLHGFELRAPQLVVVVLKLVEFGAREFE